MTESNSFGNSNSFGLRFDIIFSVENCNVLTIILLIHTAGLRNTTVYSVPFWVTLMTS